MKNTNEFKDLVYIYGLNKASDGCFDVVCYRYIPRKNASNLMMIHLAHIMRRENPHITDIVAVRACDCPEIESAYKDFRRRGQIDDRVIFKVLIEDSGWTFE